MSARPVIRTSDRKAFKKCRQMWDWGSKIRQDLEPLRVADNLVFGTAVHAALEVRYDPKTWKYPRAVLEQAAEDAFLLSWGTQRTENMAEDMLIEWQEKRELGLAMLRYYWDWAAEHDNFTPVYVEIEFEVPIDGSDAPYQGRIDLIVIDAFGQYWIVDHKTAAKLDSTDHLEFDEQVGSYAWAIQFKLGIKIAGIIYNELLKTVPHPPKVLKSGKLSVDKSQNTTYKLFKEAIAQHGLAEVEYADHLDWLKENEKQYVRRTQIHRSQRELEIIGERIALEAQDMLDPNLRIYPNPDRFNCNYCAFRTPCLAKSDGSDYQWILNENYVKRSEQN